MVKATGNLHGNMIKFVHLSYSQTGPALASYGLLCKLLCISNWLAIRYIYRAGGNCPAAPVLAGPFFLNVKIKCNFYKKQVINKSACVIFGLVRLIILSYNRKSISRSARLPAPHTLCL